MDTEWGQYFSFCEECGELHDEALPFEFWDGVRAGREEDPREHLVVRRECPPGYRFVRFRSQRVSRRGLSWADPQGDEVRRALREHNARLAPDHPDFVVEAYLSVYHPGEGRWERSYVIADASVRRYANSVEEAFSAPPAGPSLCF